MSRTSIPLTSQSPKFQNVEMMFTTISPLGYSLAHMTTSHMTTVLFLLGFINTRARPLVNETPEFSISDLPKWPPFEKSPKILDCFHASPQDGWSSCILRFHNLRPPVTQILCQLESMVAKIPTGSSISTMCPNEWMNAFFSGLHQV
jgi:hypothetical protein